MKKRRRAKRRLIVLLLVAGLAVVLLFLMYAPIFDIKTIEVYGSSKYPDETIKEASGITIGENGFRMLRFKPEAILELRLLDSEERIKGLSYVKTCVVRLQLPDRVSIAITEREPAAYLVYFDNYLIVDEQGYVLEVQNEKPRGLLKEIRGIEFAKYSIGGQLEASDISLIRTGVTVINTIKASDEYTDLKLFDVLDWVDVVDRNTALMSLDNRVIVRFDPQEELQYTIDFTKEIFLKRLVQRKQEGLNSQGLRTPVSYPIKYMIRSGSMIALLGLIAGLLIGILIPYHIPQEYSNYAAVAILAALDSVLGGYSASLEGKFDIKIFISGFFANSFMAALLAYIGDKLGIQIHLAAIFAFGNRIFLNFGNIRRKLFRINEIRK